MISAKEKNSRERGQKVQVAVEMEVGMKFT